MNKNFYVVIDFETTGKDPNTCQPVQLASVIVHPYKLEIVPGSEFQSLINPIWDEEECKRLNLEPMSKEAEAVHGKTKSLLVDAPNVEVVYKNFVDYLKEWGGGTGWSAPIPVGHNVRYDLKIMERLGSDKNVYGYGPFDKNGKWSLFHPAFYIDTMSQFFQMFERNNNITSLSLDNLCRGYMKYPDKEGHDALKDVKLTALVFKKNLKLIRNAVRNINFEGCLANEVI